MADAVDAVGVFMYALIVLSQWKLEIKMKEVL